MRVLINGVAALRPKTGIGHYIESLCEHVPPSRGDSVHVFPNELARNVVRKLLTPKSAPATPAKPAAAPKKPSAVRNKAVKWVQKAGSIVFRKAFRATAARCGADLYHEPNYIPWRCDLPAVATVHDLSVLLFPEWHPAERVKYFETHFYRALKRCVHLLADTESVRQEIIGKLGVRPDQVTTTHIGLRENFRPMSAEEVSPLLQRLKLNPGYLLHVGTIEPRKNLMGLMRAYVDLPRELRARHPLCLVGGWGWRNETIREYYETTGKHAGIIKLGYVPDEDLPALYNGARALVFPTHYEGFGLPPLEMLKCGGAALCSTAGSVMEIMPRWHEFLPPGDTEGWRDALRRVLVDDEYHAGLREGAVEHAAKFTWDRCVSETWGVYHQVLSGSLRMAA